MEEIIRTRIGVQSEQHFVGVLVGFINPPAYFATIAAEQTATLWLVASSDDKLKVVERAAAALDRLTPSQRQMMLGAGKIVMESMTGPCDCGKCPIHPFWAAGPRPTNSANQMVVDA